MPYIPPHLRPGYVASVPAPAPVPVVKRRGAHFKSNESGLPTQNRTEHRYNRNAPIISFRDVTRARLLTRRQAPKSALKGKKSQTKRRAHSANSLKRRHHTLKAKSK